MMRWTPHKKTMLRTLWHEGVGVKIICAELGCSKGSIQDQRKKLGLPTRRSICAYRITLNLDGDEERAIRRGASRRRTSLSTYLRSLIRRDASTAGGSVVVSHGGERRVVS